LRARARFSRRASDGNINSNSADESIREINRFCNRSTELLQKISNLIDDYYYYYRDSSTVNEPIEKIVVELREKISDFAEEFGDKREAVKKLLCPFIDQYKADCKYVIENLKDTVLIPQIIIIDEPELHLHVSLQKQIMPMMTKIFPDNTQFIVATHSPFVVTSLENSVVFDLETKEILECPYLYSYESIVEAFLDSSVYSAEIINHLKRYKELYLKNRTPEEKREFVRIKTELELIPPASKEIYLEFRKLEKERIEKSNGENK
jgi:hypothetical protein